MRRLPLLLALLACLLLAPAGAHAAQPGVNIVGSADVAAAAATGAKTVRVFAVRSNFSAAYSEFQGIVTNARAHGMGVIFVLVGSAVDAGHYAEILKAAYPKIKAADPQAKVLLGPLTGNNYGFLQQVYASGAGGSFDAASVHTDTACLVEPPSSFYREDGKVARFTFLGFRTVHDVMVANGDGAKPIWMTELGWTTTTSTCARGMWAGQKASGVTEAVQAADLAQAYHCLAGYPYVEAALWFTLKDSSGNGDELDHYGLQRLDGSHKPSWDAFHTVATQGDTLSGPCGDFDPPAITVKSPTANTKYVAALTLSAVATDATGVARVTFQDDGKEIRNYTGSDVGSGKPVTLEWQGSKNLSYGPHTLTVIALDPQGNTSQQ